MWIFGYGSLIWKTNFGFQNHVEGFIQGYKRKFYQLSTDHRGTPEKPGRVVTIIPTFNINDRVWGVAYEINDCLEKTFSSLDKRECNGYIKDTLIFYPQSDESKPFEVVTYIGNIKNQYFSIELDYSEISKQVACSRGESGHNSDYVNNLVDYIKQISSSISDDHLFSIYDFLNFIESDFKKK